MKGTFVDSNVILDIFTVDPIWCQWSLDALKRRANDGPLYVNYIVYAEASQRFETIEELEVALPADRFHRLDISAEAAYLAGKAFLRYKKVGGTRLSPLPDFFIGAHAAVAGLDLLTRDAARYRTYFPTVNVIAPGD